jgi:hypothetical protein
MVASDDLPRRGEGRVRVKQRGVVTISRRISGRIKVLFLYATQFVEKVRTIDSRKWHLSLLSFRDPKGRSNLRKEETPIFKPEVGYTHQVPLSFHIL